MVLFFEPGGKYLAISVTGYACELLCDYCRGRWLRGMIPAPTPSELERVLGKLARRGINGILVSGGFNREGYLPVERFIHVLREFKKQYPHVVVSLHSGLMPLELLEELTDVVDVIDLEIPLTRSQRVQMHIAYSIREYLMFALRAQALKFRVVPHLLLGLPGNSALEEMRNAVYIAATLRPIIAVLLYYVESLESPRCVIERLRRVALAIKRYVGGLSLGCMRPLHIKSREYTLYTLLTRVANPSPVLRRYFQGEVLRYCCSAPLAEPFIGTNCSRSMCIPS